MTQQELEQITRAVLQSAHAIMVDCMMLAVEKIEDSGSASMRVTLTKDTEVVGCTITLELKDAAAAQHG